jgi:hypothetical protein
MLDMIGLSGALWFDIVKGVAMPDGDVFTRSVAARWRHLAGALRDGLPADECMWRLEAGLARELRVSGGLGHVDLRGALDAGPADEASVVLGLKKLARRAVFERIMPILVSQGKYPTYEKAQNFVSYCLDQARLDVLARSVLRHPDGSGVRRPPRPRASTAELLGETAPLGVKA